MKKDQDLSRDTGSAHDWFLSDAAACPCEKIQSRSTMVAKALNSCISCKTARANCDDFRPCARCFGFLLGVLEHLCYLHEKLVLESNSEILAGLNHCSNCDLYVKSHRTRTFPTSPGSVIADKISRISLASLEKAHS